MRERATNSISPRVVPISWSSLSLRTYMALRTALRSCHSRNIFQYLLRGWKARCIGAVVCPRSVIATWIMVIAASPDKRDDAAPMDGGSSCGSGCGTRVVPQPLLGLGTCELSPARLFAHVDPERRFGHDLVGEEGAGGMEA